MGIMIAFTGFVIAAVGAAGALRPERFGAAIAATKESPFRIYAAASIRVAVGVMLILGASGSPWPTVLVTIGILAVAGGLVAPVLGIDRVRSMIDWWEAQTLAFRRASFAAAGAIGAFLVYAGLGS